VFYEVTNTLTQFIQLKIESNTFLTFLEAVQPYLRFITKSMALIRQYCRAIGVKINQLDLVLFKE